MEKEGRSDTCIHIRALSAAQRAEYPRGKLHRCTIPMQPSSTNKLERKAFQVHLMKRAYFQYANDDLATCLANYGDVVAVRIGEKSREKREPSLCLHLESKDKERSKDLKT